jgi:hypothetical protein
VTLPIDPEKYHPELLTELIRERYPDAAVESLKIVETKVYGDGMVSTAGRIVFDLDYSAQSPADLPSRVVVKIARGGPSPGRLYRNEVSIYNKLRPDTVVEAPRSLGARFDEGSGTFALILEDLRVRHAAFPNAATPVTLEQLYAIVTNLADLHAKFWNSPRFSGDLSWLETHVSGPLHQLFTDRTLVPAMIEQRVAEDQFRREMLDRLGMTTDALYKAVARAQQHQSTLPQTVVHGDTHIGNTYLLPDNRAGLLDWQLSVRGFCLHDVSYVMMTGLPIGVRRAAERDLLRYYRECLRERGVADLPSEEFFWLEYRRCAAWAVYIGWLTCPVVNYGWEITVINHLRVMTAYEDLETNNALAPI